ncbi:MAG: hypothetical protein AAF902_21260 [Chloroflexota bacterium]
MIQNLCTAFCPVTHFILEWWLVVFVIAILWRAATSKQDLLELLDTYPTLLFKLWTGFLILWGIHAFLIFSGGPFRFLAQWPNMLSTLFFFAAIVPIVYFKRKWPEARY